MRLPARCVLIGYGPAVLERLYRSLAERYRRSEPGSSTRRRAFEMMVDVLAHLIVRGKGLRFPEQRVGGWWWTGRWRFEFAMGWLEPESVDWVRRLVTPGMTVLDIGAHVGFYTRVLSDLVGPTGRVLAFEPHPVNFSLLRHNTRHCSNVELYDHAVGNVDGPVGLHVSAGHSNHSLIDGFTEELDLIEVQGITLDSFLPQRGIDKIEFIKIDVEGAEPLVLSGMADTLRSSGIVAMLTELNPVALNKGGSSAAQYVHRLEGLGFAVRAIGSDGHLEEPPTGQTVVNLLCTPVG